MSIDHGKLLALADHAAALSQRLSRMGGDSAVFRAVEAREIEQGLRALAQPAEAVELSDDAKRMLALESDQVFREQYDDAAQGAVSDLSLIARRLLADQFPHQVTKDLLVIDGLADGVVDTRLALAAIENALRTHPQAAPAQVDDSRRLDWLDANEAEIRYWREDAGDDEYLIWCTVVKGGKSISGHPLATAREAIDAAIAAAPSPETRS